MTTGFRPTLILLPAVVTLTACAGAPPTPEPQPTTVGTDAPATAVASDTLNAQHAFTAADVRFMGAMIAHHAQALVMAGWAASHGASPAVRTLADRIINAQRE